MKSVIIDDERFAISLLSKMIFDNFPEISELKTTNHPLEGIDLINTFKPEILFIDIEMPHMNGFELLAEIKKDEKLKHLPVLMVTAEARKEDIVRAAQQGAAGYIVKPFTKATLEDKVNLILTKVGLK